MALPARAEAAACARVADGDEKRENCILLHQRFFKLGAPLTVVLVCFAKGVGTYI
jgi:hypothetical protein